MMAVSKEQGKFRRALTAVYLRLLFALWRAGGKIVHDDSAIASKSVLRSKNWTWAVA